MFKHINTFLASALVLALAACSSDEPVDVVSTSGETVTYGLNVSLTMPTSTSRGDDTSAGVASIADDDYYYNGSESEHNIEVIYFVFYNENGVRVASTSVSSPQFTNSTALGITKELNTRVEFTLPVGTRLPAYVMAYANPRDVSYAQSATLNEMKTAVRGFYADNNGNFIMSNSTYFDADGVSCTEVATPEEYYIEVDEETATISSDSAPSVQIYLERIAVKVGVVTDYASISDVTLTDADGNDMKIMFVVDAWGINCAPTQSYYVKYFDPSTYNSTYVKSTFDTNSYIFNGWNSPSEHRCFWAYSYLAGQVEEYYPEYADELYSGSDTFLQNTVENGAAYINNTDMNYITFNQIVNKSGEYDYCLEHTPAFYTMPSALTSVIIAGHYEFNGEALESFYVIANNYEGSSSAGTYYTETTLKKYFLSRNNGYIVRLEDGSALEDGDEADFILVHPVADAADEYSTANVARLVTINIDPDKISKYGVKKDDGSVVPILNSSESNGTYVSMDDVNARLYLYADVAESFTNGNAYYHWPIRHLNNTDQEGRGYYATVRNHWYSINVASIKGLGTGVFNPDVPIVPQDEQTRYSINADIKVLAWRLVEQQASLGK